MCESPPITDYTFYEGDKLLFVSKRWSGVWGNLLKPKGDFDEIKLMSHYYYVPFILI